MRIKRHVAATVLALGLIFLGIADAARTPAMAQADAAYAKAVGDFRSVLAQRRAQIDAHQALPNLPGQPLYLARNAMMSSLQGPHRRGTVQDRQAEQIRHSAGLFRRRQRAAAR